MGVVIKRKAAAPLPPVVSNDLDDVGLSPEVSAFDQIVHHPRLLKPGTRVECLAPGIGSWYPYWQPGDTGVVQRGFLAAGLYENQPDNDVYLVLMDKPRTPKHPETHLHGKHICVAVGRQVEQPKQRPVPDPIPKASTPLPVVVKESPRPVLASSVPVRSMGISKIKRAP